MIGRIYLLLSSTYLVLFICNWMSALIRMTMPGTVPALFCRKYLKKGSTFLNAFHLHGNMMWHTWGPPLVRSQLVRFPLVRTFKKVSKFQLVRFWTKSPTYTVSSNTIFHQNPPLVRFQRFCISLPLVPNGEEVKIECLCIMYYLNFLTNISLEVIVLLHKGFRLIVLCNI